MLQVDDPERHLPFATLSRCCTVYARCQRHDAPPIFIAAVLTRGDLNQLMPGRCGLFYDRQGRDWDAVVVRLVEAPLSIRQAFWTPWRKLASFIETQAENLASSKQTAVDGVMDSEVRGVLGPGAGPAANNEPHRRTPFDIARFVGIFAAIGLAIGAMGGALGSMLATFARLAWWQIPLALLGIMLVVSGPAMILAWMKLRNRTLGPLLEGCGWAVNGRVHITRPLGKVLTQAKRLPAQRRRASTDPYGVYPWQRWILIAAALIGLAVAGWWYHGSINPELIEMPQEHPAPDENP